VVGGKAGINGHVTVGDGVQLAGTSNIVKDTPAGVIMIGTPAESQRDFMGRLALPNKVDKLKAKIAELTERLEKLENK
jgi:UDP-3-O-[3-hydroxymyristoyl] glucosamine N-acyltransferase